MAYAERPTFSQAIPAKATVRTEKGKRYACWTDRSGRPVKARVLADKPDRCLRTVAGRWVGHYRDGRGKRLSTDTFGDRNAALAEAIKLERQCKAVAEGRESPTRPKAHSQLIDLLPAYLTYLELVRGAGVKRVREVRGTITRIISTHGLTTPGAVDCEALAGKLERDRQKGPPKDQPGKKKRGGLRPAEYSMRTRNIWVTMLRAFGKWMVKKAKVTAANPFDELETTNDEPHKTFHRRAVPVESYVALVTAARNSPDAVEGLNGPDRAMLYLLGGFTGLRAGALRKLTPEAFTWTGGEPTAVYSSARLQKNKGAHGVSLSPTIRGEVGAWLRTRTPGQPIFPGNAHMRTADMIRHDLAAAGVPFKDASGVVFDFHSLRVETAFLLFSNGASLPEVQQVLDHSTPTLTANVYAKFGGELADTMARIPALPGLSGTPSLGANLGAAGGSSRQTDMPKCGKSTPPRTKKTQRSQGKR